MEDNKLWEKFLRGDRTALSLIFRSYYDELYNYGLKLTNSHDVVEDSLQDMFFKLWKNRSNFGSIDNLKPYLLKALRRQIIHKLQWQDRFISYVNPPEHLFSIEFSHEDFLINRQLDCETRENLINAINKLTKRQKEAIYLRYFKGLDFETIADIMSMKVQSVRNSIHRGLVALRDLKKSL